MAISPKTEYVNRFKQQARALVLLVQQLENTVQEGKDRGFVSPDDHTPGSIVDADLVGTQLSYLAAADLAALVATLDMLRASLDANDKAVRKSLYRVIG